MKQTWKKLVCGVLTAAASLIIAGCTPSYDVEVYLSPKLKEKYQIYPSLEVDLVGTTQSEAEPFETIKVSEYFMPGNPLRDGTDQAMFCFSNDDAVPKKLSSSDPIWKKFHNHSADQIMILVNLPGADQFKGKKNPCRLTVPLKNGWFGISETKIFEITPGGIQQIAERPENIRETPQLITTGNKR